jgi:hypothetical protein
MTFVHLCRRNSGAATQVQGASFMNLTAGAAPDSIATARPLTQHASDRVAGPVAGFELIRTAGATCKKAM